MHHSSLQVRVLCQARVNILCCFVENFTSCHRVADSFMWIRNLKDACHELSDTVGAITFARSPSELRTLNHSEGHKDYCKQGCYGDGDSMPSDVLLHAIGKARWPCLYRFMIKIAATIRGQLAWRGIAAGAVSLKRSHGDPVEVSTEHGDEFLWLCSARLCRRFRCVVLLTGFRAWP